MRTLFPMLALAALVACAPKPSVYTLENGGLSMEITDYGARVMSLMVPDRDGNCVDVVVGFDEPGKYLTNPGERFLGSSPGPVANRIGGACFTLDGKEYVLDRFTWDVITRKYTEFFKEVSHEED